jgi:putative SOS response-associated peptidase YedK
MCGRYTNRVTWREIHDAYESFLTELEKPIEAAGWREPEEPLAPRYNLAPTQLAPILVAQADGSTAGVMARWDFVPFFFKQPLETKKWTSFNAKLEEIATKPAFRDAVKSRRCLVPNQGFIEWKREGAAKQPYLIEATDAPVSFFAGVWDRWEGVHKGAPAQFTSFAVLTCEANPLVAPIHDRMPVMLRPEACRTWLFGDRDAALAAAGPYPSQMMRARPINPAIGNVRNEGPELLG